jgi:hypothetical protein
MALFDALRFKIGADLSDFEKGMRKVDSIAESSTQTLGNAFKAVGAIGVGVFGAAGALTKSVVETSSQMETLEARLSSLLGSATAGKERLNELVQIGATSPFDVTQLAEATATLEAFTGQSQDLLGPVQDLAVFMNTDLNEAAQSLGRAFAGGAGAADVLRERGILRMVELQEGVKATELSVDELQGALVDLMTDPDGQIAGGADRLANTWAGMTSNMEDQWVQFQTKIGDSGLFDGLQRAGRELLTIWDENIESVDELSNEIGTGLLAGIGMMVEGVGFVVDAWTLLEAGVIGVQGYFKNLQIELMEIARLSLIVDEALGFSEEGSVNAMEERISAAREEMEALDKAALDTVNSMGAGAEMAERINKALLDGSLESTGLDRQRGGGGGEEEEKPAGLSEELLAEIDAAVALQDQMQDDYLAHQLELEDIAEKGAKRRLEQEKKAARERLKAADMEARQREAIANEAVSSLQSIVSQGQQIWLESESTTADKVTALSLSTFSELLAQLAAYLFAKGAANIAAQNYLLGAAQIAGGTIASGAAGALAAESDSVAAGEGSSFATEEQAAPSRSFTTSANPDDTVAVDLSRAADALESAAESLEGAAVSLSRVSGGSGGGGFSVQDDRDTNGPLRRLLRRGRAGFRGT